MEEKRSLTKAQLASLIATYLNANKIGVMGFTASKDNVLGLLDKIGKQVFIDGVYSSELDFMNGDVLPAGKTIEEYFEDFIAPEPYAKNNGVDNLNAPEIGSRPVTYSYTLGKQVFPLKKYFNDLERAFRTEAGAINALNTIVERLESSYLMWRDDAKRGLLGYFGKRAEDAMTPSKTFAVKTAYSVGESVKDNAGNVAIVFKTITTANTLAWAEAIKAGLLAPIHLVSSVDTPTDADTGENFIIAVKEQVNKMRFKNHENLNGALVKPTPQANRRLIINVGLMPTLEVKTLAGAFHEDKLSYPAVVTEVEDFGEGHDDILAILIDDRGAKLHNSWSSTLDQIAGRDNAILYFKHTEDTAFISCNTFIHVFKKKA